MKKRYRELGYKNRRGYLRAFKQYIAPYLLLTLPEEWTLKEKKREIRRIKREYPKYAE